MEYNNKIKGIIFGLIALLLVSFQPIVAILRPEIIDAYIFAAMTCLIITIIFLPLVILERKKIKSKIKFDPENSLNLELQLHGWKKHYKLLIYLGINFAIAQVLFFTAYQLAGAINGSLAAQSTLIFALLFGFLINHEKISKIQIIFSILLLFGLILAITQGSLNILEFNMGVLIMMITAILWMLAHTLTKPILDKNELTTTQLVFIRNFLSSIILLSTYFIFFPLDNIEILLNPYNYIFFILMGFLYAFDLFFWYKSLSHIEVSKASIIVSPMPILTAFLAYIFLSEIFTIYHLIGSMIIIFSICIITAQKNNPIYEGDDLSIKRIH